MLELSLVVGAAAGLVIGHYGHLEVPLVFAGFEIALLMVVIFRD